MFFTNDAAAKREAKGICKGCPVSRQCYAAVMEAERADATEAPETNRKRRYGIFAGLTSHERWARIYPEAAKLQRERGNAKRKRNRDKGVRNDLRVVPQSG